MTGSAEAAAATPFGQGGRVALVTGAGSTDRHRLRRPPPCSVGSAPPSPSRPRPTGCTSGCASCEALGVTATGHVGDLTDPDVAAAASSTTACASTGGSTSSSTTPAWRAPPSPTRSAVTSTRTDPERWRRSIARNLDTAYFVTRAAMPHLRASGSGRVVFVSSVTGAVMAMRTRWGMPRPRPRSSASPAALAVDEGPQRRDRQRGGTGVGRHGLADRDEAVEGGRRRSAGRALPRRSQRRSRSSSVGRLPTSPARCSSSTAATRWRSSAPSTPETMGSS